MYMYIEKYFIAHYSYSTSKKGKTVKEKKVEN